MSSKLFQYAIIAHPTDNESDEGKGSEVLVPVTTVLAANENAAVLMAGRAIPDAWVEKLERVEVVVRPF